MGANRPEPTIVHYRRKPYLADNVQITEQTFV
jgi:hypothetical protein